MDMFKDTTMLLFWLIVIVGAFVIGFLINLFYNAMDYFGFKKTKGDDNASDG